MSKNKGYCSKNEFTLLMLIRQGLINEKDLELCREKFDKLDTDRSGKVRGGMVKCIDVLVPHASKTSRAIGGANRR